MSSPPGTRSSVETEPQAGVVRETPSPLATCQVGDLETFIESYQRKTAESRAFADSHRAHHADKSSIALGTMRQTEALSYPIVTAEATGSRLRDIDGNEYVDVLQGLGTNLFGHNPEFIRAAIARQLEQGFPIGVQTWLVGQVAAQVVQLTGMPRVCFSNTGTEAVMTALRVARAKTGRSKVAIFTDSYHGHADSVLMRARIAEYARRKLARRFQDAPILGPLLRRGRIGGAVPASPGVPAAAGRDCVVLEYGVPRSLEVVRRLRNRLAGVLVEPVQSRRPELQPRDFLHELRSATRDVGAALIFDEMVTGFRVHPGGAQAFFDVEADLATYSKIVGGGLPLSILAGRNEFMDHLHPREGGPTKTIFFAGTFCKHPLALAASHALLTRLIEAGPQLQRDLNMRTQGLVERLNVAAREEQLPIQFTRFGSFFSVDMSHSSVSIEQIVLLSYLLIFHGVHLRGGDRGGFLTVAHTEEDVSRIVDAFRTGLRSLSRLSGCPSNAGDARRAKSGRLVN
ncbi:MAG: aminotransferase class III-fold pyridoxal phosphate-dependent enzyme [Planctomycetota bacterium]